jgi:hypothetical protein
MVSVLYLEVVYESEVSYGFLFRLISGLLPCTIQSESH